MNHDWTSHLALQSQLRASASALVDRPPGPFDVVLSHNEVNDRHGTGILIQHLFPYDSQVVSIRSYDQWAGEQTFGRIRLLIPEGLDRGGIYRWVLGETADLSIKRVICVPFSAHEVIASIALHDAYGAPFYLYVMDDQNIISELISDDLIGEAIEKATLRFAISSDMRDAYETKYDRRFYLLPPTTSPSLRRVASQRSETNSAVLVGNIWGRSWLTALRSAIVASRLRVDWFASTVAGGMLNLDNHAELASEGIVVHAPLPEPVLASRLQDYEVALVPTVPGRGERENASLSLSLPSRVVFLLGASDVPILVLGDKGSFAARFVEHYSLGIACDYSAASIQHALEIVRDRAWRLRQRRSLDELRDLLYSDIATWFQEALIGNQQALQKFDHLEVLPAAFVRHYVEDRPAPQPWMQPFEPVGAAFRRLARLDYQPDFVLDVGASTGVWSLAVSKVYPHARFVLVEPLYSRYPEADRNTFAFSVQDMEVHELAIGASDGRVTLMVDDNLYRSSIVEASPGAAASPVEVALRGLDSLAHEIDLRGRGILKLDIQGAELEALKGGDRLLKDQVDVIVAEMNLEPDEPDHPPFDRVHEAIVAAGFIWFDELGSFRDPDSGILQEKDVLYVRRDGPLAALRREL